MTLAASSLPTIDMLAARFAKHFIITTGAAGNPRDVTRYNSTTNRSRPRAYILIQFDGKQISHILKRRCY